MTDTPRTYITPGAITGGAPTEGHPLTHLADTLTTTVDLLQAAYHTMCTDVAGWMQGDPHQARDTSGRYIVIDALVALANAQSALANLHMIIAMPVEPWGGGITTDR